MDASQMTCPKCGWAREPNAVECPACGIVYARFGASARRPAETGAFAPPPAASVSEISNTAVNPYAPPRADLRNQIESPIHSAPVSGGVWRTGDVLVLQKGAALPNRCVVCNGPAAVQWPKKLYWHHPGIYLLVLLNLLVYAIAALAVRKKAELVIPLCAEHDQKRRNAVSLSWLIALGGILLMAGSCTQLESNEGLFVGILLFGLLVVLSALVVGSKGNPVLPKKIDDYYVWLKKVHSSYLASLPPAPPGL